MRGYRDTRRVTTLYDGSGNPKPLVCRFPPHPRPPWCGRSTDGQAFNTFDNTSTDFVISKDGTSGPAFFLFATEDGTIAGWNRTRRPGERADRR